MVETLNGVSSDMSKAGLRLSKRFLMLIAEANLLNNNLEACLLTAPMLLLSL